MAKPSFDWMWTYFPDHGKYPTLKDLFGWLGGGLKRNIDEPGFGPAGNTCAARMSRALNYANHPITAKQIKQLSLNALLGDDKKHYLFRVRELRTYLTHTIGVTPKTVKKDFQTAFAGERGIVAFRVAGWQSASGHIALWDGSSFRENDHDDYRAQQDDPSTAENEGTVEEMVLWPL
ncbi:T6SS effector amidase Tae4 family protein [Methylobacterium trifolii]|uniref:Type VI secretion system (T6SS) effector Tae4 (Amidase) n=1 Tax=Methylobacterium trifolii TaxID=1003092 RepID=A0ABQ4U339_9HYPH|nr:T6SS effector amidase Tae4 family protein [Methylobacterium trifolii]GJE61676.1 hypothetical protein MPOCJGCO_3799 [Methylobacterium trifolii]